jgi:hypothetical protein
MSKFRLFAVIPLLVLMIILAPTTAFVKASNEGSYVSGFWSGSNSGPQNNSTQNSYPTFDNNTCSLSNSSTLSNGIIMPAITNATSCQDGWYNGYKSWCNNHSLDCIQNVTSGQFPPMISLAKEQYNAGAKAANDSGTSMCPVGNNAVYCLGFDSNNGDYGNWDCSDSPLANITGNLIGCLQDIVTNNQISIVSRIMSIFLSNFVNR